MTSWLTAEKNSRQAMAAVSASPPIRAAAPAFVAGWEAGLPIKPLIARIGQRYGAGDRQVFRQAVACLRLSLCFLAGCRPISNRLPPARSPRYFIGT